MVRVSAISFLNTVPLVRAMVAEAPAEMQVEFTSPSECADQLRSGRAGVGLIPAIEYQRIPGLVILGDAAIACQGAVRSIQLLSRKPLAEVHSVAMDTASRTSVALTQILFELRFGRRIELSSHAADAPAMLKNHDAALLIGDPALHYAQNPLDGVAAYDLGEMWRAVTGKAFVFAFWAARKEAGAGRWAPSFNRWRDAGLAEIEKIIEEEAPRRGLPPEIVRAYLTHNIHFTLDQEAREGLQEFYRLARNLNLIPSAELEYQGAAAC